MDWILLAKALVMGIVEGLSEFLPISSTGHLILAGSLLDFVGPKAKVFEIVIQGAAILAVCWEYRVRLCETLLTLPVSAASRRFAVNIFIAFLPLAILGLLFKSFFETYFFNPFSVAVAFIAGGLFIFWAEKRQHRIRVHTVDELRPLDALKLGFCQAFALIPGTSRSGATIVGGLFLGLSRRAAAEFSFFLAIPTLIIATLYQLYSARDLLTAEDAGFFIAGSVAAFISAFLAVRGLLRYITTHNFIPFGYYRIIFGILVLATMSSVPWHGE